MLLAIALVVLMPLKTVEPYTLLVDRQTGFVQALEPLDPERISPRQRADPVLPRPICDRARELRRRMRCRPITARSRSGRRASARSTYVAGQQVSNPESPLARYPRSTVVETGVKSVSPVGRNVAMVRFETRRRDAGGQLRPAQRLGGDDPLPLFGRADADRGPDGQPARLPGAALPPRRRGAAAAPSPRRSRVQPVVSAPSRSRRRRSPPSRGRSAPRAPEVEL